MVGGDIIKPFPDRFNVPKILMLLELLVAPLQLG
jgi:hypothetical protein